MIKPEWGVKRQCPKCNTRFYDLGKEDPCTCIACQNAWTPEPVLKSKQPLPYDAPKAVAAPVDPALESEDIELDEAEAPADDDTDIVAEDELAEVVDPASEEEA